MKIQLQQLITAALDRLIADGTLAVERLPGYKLERSRDRAHGDFACNAALVLAKPARRKPRELAELIVAALPDDPLLVKTEIAGPGFINFFLDPTAQTRVIDQVLDRADDYGRSDQGAGQRVLVEFVSANPTGPLHVGHGRHAAYGATLAKLLAAIGYEVECEYYVNDAGRQMDILAVSVWLRYLQRRGQTLALPFPANGYRGDYVRDIAEQLEQRVGGELGAAAAELYHGLPADGPQPDEQSSGEPTGDKEAHIDAIISRAKQMLGERYQTLFDFSQNAMLDDIRNDLDEFGVVFDRWFSERGLTESGAVDDALETLLAADKVYEKDGALWFDTKAYGDDKDRVVRRADGRTTYFASDIAYIADKFRRGFDRLVYVWGADHHGTIVRLLAACEAQGYNRSNVDVPLVQFVNLFRGREKMKMTTRGGQFVTLRELRRDVGNDAARFFYINRKNEQHLDFDLELAKSQTNDNPVYYLQYAHARVCSVLAKLGERAWRYQRDDADLSRLDNEHEQSLLTLLARYPETVAAAACGYDPQLLAQYLRELANAFHSYYNAHKVLIDDAPLRNARLALSQAVAQVLRNGLALLGVSAPESM